jgi:hypothetical protein
MKSTLVAFREVVDSLQPQLPYVRRGALRSTSARLLQCFRLSLAAAGCVRHTLGQYQAHAESAR